VTSDAAFIAFTCQRGAEPALKRELAAHCPAWRLAYSRPGFLTFKLPANRGAVNLWNLPLVFARWRGVALGNVQGGDESALAAAAWERIAEQKLDGLHVFAPDAAAVGYRGYVPGPNDATLAAAEALRKAAPGKPVENATRPGQAVLDCVVLKRDEWWLGWHPIGPLETSWPGGVPPIALPEQAVSRAWLKMTEALLWSGFSPSPRRRWVEIGCAPGGAAEALLDRGLRVTGIDPAAVDPRVAEHPRFTWVQKKAQQVRRRFFRPFHYLVADMNVAPRYTLDSVEAIVTHPEVNVRGLLLTLKLTDWQLADELPEYCARISNWGYASVRVRQLAFNRQEVCVAAER